LEAFQKVFAAVHPFKFILEFGVYFGCFNRLVAGLLGGFVLRHSAYTSAGFCLNTRVRITTKKVYINYIKFQSRFLWFFHVYRGFLNGKATLEKRLALYRVEKTIAPLYIKREV
jgi:hypothetical protein